MSKKFNNVYINNMYDSDGDPIIENQLAILLLLEVVFLSDFSSKESWSKYAQSMIAVNVLCNDCFTDGADAEELSYEEIPKLFKYYEEDNVWGSYVWCIEKRDMLPQKSIYDELKKAGWDLTDMRLKENPTWSRE